MRDRREASGATIRQPADCAQLHGCAASGYADSSAPRAAGEAEGQRPSRGRLDAVCCRTFTLTDLLTRLVRSASAWRRERGVSAPRFHSSERQNGRAQHGNTSDSFPRGRALKPGIALLLRMPVNSPSCGASHASQRGATTRGTGCRSCRPSRGVAPHATRCTAPPARQHCTACTGATQRGCLKRRCSG